MTKTKIGQKKYINKRVHSSMIVLGCHLMPM